MGDYAKKSLIVDNVLECVTVECEINRHKTALVSCVYRCPGSNMVSFNDNIEQLFSHIRCTKTIYVCGDFNIDLFKCDSHSGTKLFVDLMYSLGLYPLINRPSRITTTSATLIDNIFTSELECKIDSGLLVNDISDHLPVFALCPCIVKRDVNEHSNKCIRHLSEENINALKCNLMQNSWHTVIGSENANIAYDNFLHDFTQMYNKHCPVSTVRPKVLTISFKKPWFTKGLRNACIKKNHLYKAFLSSRSIISETRYKSYKNKLTGILRSTKKQYYSSLLAQKKNYIAGTWKVLKTVMGTPRLGNHYPDQFVNDGITISNKEDVANMFNNYFTNIGPELSKDITAPTNVSIYDYLENRNSNNLFLTPVNEDEVIRAVNNWESKTSTDCEDISMHLVKEVINSIAKPITYICNLSFTSGVFPEKMKIAKVIPLFKSGDKYMCTNYRPISLLPQFSKILEKLFSSRLDSFITKHKLINPSQYGFQQNMSTCHALIDLVDAITQSLDAKKYAIGVFIDLKKAFDTVDHKLLCKKMEFLGIRGGAFNWLNSFLENRKQFVSIDKCNSTVRNISCGVPQGSILGPKLFILYVNDMCNISNLVKYILFADDTNIFYANSNINKLNETVCNVLDQMYTWFAVNKLTLNISKTNYMLFGNRMLNKEINIKIQNVNIERVRVTKFLGVFIDDLLNWKAHIKYVQSKLSKSTAIMHRCSHLLDRNSRRILYSSLFLPYLNYCAEIWGNTYPTNTNCIFLLQKRVIRIIFGARWLDHTNSLFQQLHVLKFPDIIELKTSLFMYKAYYSCLPSNIQCLFTRREIAYSMRANHDLERQRVCSTMRSMSLCVKGVQLWNSLCDHLKTTNTITEFKRKCKNLLFEKYLVVET